MQNYIHNTIKERNSKQQTKPTLNIQPTSAKITRQTKQYQAEIKTQTANINNQTNHPQTPG